MSMIIGSDFNKKCREFLAEAADISMNKTGIRIPVIEVNKSLNFSRNDVKNVVGFLTEMGFLKMETLGGPLLYGHISVTDKGLDKLDQ